MKRRMLFVVMTACLTFALSAGGGAEDTADAGPATISMMGGGHLVSIAEVVLEDFLAERPDIVMEYQKFPFAEYPTKMMLQLTAGESDPDVMIIHDFLAPQFTRAGWLMDLTDKVPVEDLLPSLGAATAGDRIFGLPNQSIVTAYLYRQDVYDRLGISPPTTLEEYIAAARVLREQEFYIDAYDPNTNGEEVYLVYLHMLGGSIFDYNGNVTLNSPEAVRALELLRSAVEEGLLFPSDRWQSDEYWTAMNAGQIVSLFGPSFTAAYFENNIDPGGQGGAGQWRMAEPPRFSQDGPGTYSTNTEYWVINKGTEHPEISWDLIRYLALTEQAGKTFSEIDREGLMVRMTNNYLPSLRNIASASKGWEMFGGQQILSKVSEILMNQNPRIPYKDARTSEAERILEDALSAYFAGNGKTADQVIADAAQEIRAIQ